MDKSAKELFKELGYNDRTELYEKDELKEIKFINDGDWVIISKEKIEYVENRNRGNLPIKFLKAINKQVEELGWNE